jgi:hypothetical protein
VDDPLGLLVASFAEVLIAHDSVPVDEVERRPVVVIERAPDLVVVVDRDRIVDLSRLDRLTDAVDLVLESELRRMDPDNHESVVSVRPRPRADVRLLAKPVDACQGPEVHEDDVTPQLGGTEWL